MNIRISRFARAAGFSLIELMVAMTLGLVVLGGVVTVMVNSKKNYTMQDSLARLQENARFAMGFIIKDVRMAGYFGCADNITEVYNHINGGSGTLLDAEIPLKPLEGYEQDGSTWQPSEGTDIGSIKAGTDAITLRFLDAGNSIAVTAPPMPQAAANIQVETPGGDNGLRQGDIVTVTDCESADIFQISGPADDGPGTTGVLIHNTGNATSPGNVNTYVPGCPGQNAHCLSKIYDENAQVMKLTAVRYFVADTNRGVPALFRQSVGAQAVEASQEIVDGIENLQILYGEDTDLNDRIPDVYVPANIVSDWANVVSVRIVLLAYSIASATDTGQYGAGADTNAYNLDLSGDSNDEVAGTTGNRKRRIFVSTISLRNIK